MRTGRRSLIACGVLLLVLAGCLVQAAAAAETYQYLGKWGSEGAGDGQFGRPVGIASDGQDRVYVAEEVHDRVQAFDANGTFLFTLAGYGNGPGQVNSPQDVAVDAGGTVYVADMYNYRVQKFAPGGAFLGAWGSYGTGNGQFGAPVGVAADAAGHVYVTDFTNHRVQVFDANGTFVRAWGSRGSGDGQFQFPMGVAVGPDGYVYVVDDDNYRVQVFDQTGAFVRKWGSDAQFTNPRGIAIDGAGFVYVSEGGRHEVQKFTPDGTPVASWGAWGSGDGQFIGAVDVAVDAGGETAWVVDMLNYRVQKFGRVAADFSADTTSGPAPLAVRFADGSSGAGIAERTWTFGDGAVSNGTDPFHTYTVPGTYTVTLTVETARAAVTETKTGYITVSALQAPVAQFHTSYGGGGDGILPVPFFDDSTGDGITNWSWDFGDGQTSTEQNPVHKYDMTGLFTVSLTVTNAAGSDSEVKTDYIQIGTPRPLARFEANATSGMAPLAVGFTDTSNLLGQNLTSRLWEFGDGATSTEPNPVHVYAAPGTYTVNLTVANLVGPARLSKPGYITVTEPPIAGADRGYYLVSTVPAGAAVYLEDLSGARRLQGNTSAGPLNVTICRTCTPVRKIVATLPGYLEAAYAIAAYPAKGETVPVTLTLRPGTDGPFPAPHVPASLIQAEDYDLGGEGVAYHDVEPANLGRAYRPSEGVDIETVGGVTNVGWVRDGEYLRYTVDTTIAGRFWLTLRAANPDPARKRVGVLLDGEPYTEVQVPPTGGWTGYAESGGAEPLYLRAGRHTVTLAFDGVDRLNLDWLRLAAGTGPTVTATPTPAPSAGASLVAAPLSAPHGAAVRFTVTPAAGKTVRSAWWSFDAPAHLNTWNSRAINPTFFYPRTGTFSPLVKLTYTDGSTETVQRAGYVRAT